MATSVKPPYKIKPKGTYYYTIWKTLFEIDMKYVPIKPIGRGSYGVVCSSINKDTNEKVAIMKISNIFDNCVDSVRTLRELIDATSTYSTRECDRFQRCYDAGTKNKF
jgi:mitogen-activated protein kinase 1/3